MRYLRMSSKPPVLRAFCLFRRPFDENTPLSCSVLRPWVPDADVEILFLLMDPDLTRRLVRLQSRHCKLHQRHTTPHNFP